MIFFINSHYKISSINDKIFSSDNSNQGGKVKVKVHTLNIAPLYSESPPYKRSGMARVLKAFHSFTAHPHVHPQSE